MKRFYLIAITIMACCMFTTACSSDDNDISTSPNDNEQQETSLTPKYASVANKYVFTNCKYDYIELTESGSYIVKENRDTRARDISVSDTRASDITANDTVFIGTFSIANGNTIVLEGIGNMVINEQNDTNVEIYINSEKYSAKVAAQVSTSDSNAWIFRTWNITKYTIKPANLDIKLSVTNSIDFSNILAKYGINIPAFESFIITKSGTFFPSFLNGYIKEGSWSWNNENLLKMNVSYTVAGQEVSASVTLDGNNKEMTITQTTSQGTIIFTLASIESTEAK